MGKYLVVPLYAVPRVAAVGWVRIYLICPSTWYLGFLVTYLNRLVILPN